jgi:hypothetical protein
MLYHHTVVIKEWCEVARDLLCRITLPWCYIMRGKTHQCKQRKQSDCLMFIHSYCVCITNSWAYFHFPGHYFNISGNCTVHISQRKRCLTINGRFRVKTTEVRRVHVHSSLLVVTSNQNASNKKKNRLNIYPKPGMSHYIPCLIAE